MGGPGSLTAVYMVCKWPLKRKGLRRHRGIEDFAISGKVVFEPDLVSRGVGEEWDV
jgi:hypothetical protein